MTDLKNKIALVTGAGSGIGRATSVALSVKGAKVIVTDRNEDSGNNSVENIISNIVEWWMVSDSRNVMFSESGYLGWA